MNIFMTNKQKRLADKEVDIYKREQQVRFDEEMVERAEKSFEELHVTRLKNINAVAASNEEFRTGIIEKGVEIAKVEAKLENRQELFAKLDSIPELESRVTRAEALVEAKNLIIEHLEAEVSTAQDFSKFLAGLLPKMELDKLNLNLNADIKTTVKSDA